MTSSIILIALLFILTTTTQSYIYNQNYGPFFYPNGSRNDSIFMTFGAHNTTHFYLNLHVTGNHWFGFALPDDCTPNSGCTGNLRPSGCVTPNTAISGCKMAQSDAIVFGNYGGTLMVTALEWTLGDHSRGNLHANQNSMGIYYQESFTAINTYYNAYITRPYDPYKYGDRSSHKITYPFAGSFCWLWAIGEGLYYGPESNHSYAGYQCIDFGGTTDVPTPTPTYGPTYKPTMNPTLKPTKMPSTANETAHPTPDPTKEPSISPTEVSAAPSVTPTRKPTPGPTVREGEPTNTPTKKPTPTPSGDPTVSPTPEPTDAPLEPGQTKSPSFDPTSSPTTYEPSPGPTHKPTPSPTFVEVIDDMDIEANASTDNSWLEENLTWILMVGVIAVIMCFCSACLCFWCMQKRRTEKRRERRFNLLEAERFKVEHGLNIDAENRTRKNRAIAQRMAAKYRKRSNETDTGTRSASGLRYGYGYGDDDGSTTESDEFFMDDLEYGHNRTKNKYRSRKENVSDYDNDDEKAEIYETPGDIQGGRGFKANEYRALKGGRKKKYKPVGRGRRDKGKTRKPRKSKFVQHGLDEDGPLPVARPIERKRDKRNVISSSDSSD